VLWASEGRIYQRFGYGMAAKTGSLEIDTLEVSLLRAAPAGGSLRVAVPAEIRKDMQDLYERKRATQTGLSSRDDRWWDKITSDPESRRAGYTARRAVLYDGSDGPGGYALWRSKPSWDHKGPGNETKVVELIAVHPEAYAALWQFLLSLDLARTVNAGIVAAEEPILYLVNEPNQLGMRVGDGLWIRLIDLPKALTARRYPVPVDVVLEVTDELLPANAGRWRLRANADGTAQCSAASGEPADLAMDIADLGAVYLGGTPLSALAHAGRVRELRSGTLAVANSGFSWPAAPAPVEIF
jgi:predicted acetyltransferase